MSQIIKEKIWVEEQTIIEDKNDDSIIFIAKIKGYTEIKSWVLGMGSSVQVISPQKLIDDVKEEAEKIKNIYL
jgi:predicted DNA-binding transcriptional regulator YafY